MLVKEKKISKAEEILAQFAEKFPEKSKLILLVRAQISAAAGHFHVAAESLSMIQDIRHMPATVATVVSLKERLNDFNGAVGVLDSAIQWWKDAMTEDNKLSVIIPEAASFKLNHGHEREAFKLYEELVQNHGNTEALVGLVKTAAHTDLVKAESYEKQLKELPGLKGINVVSLEKTSGAKHVEGTIAGKMDVSEEVKKTKSKKRKRKPRYPKGFDPANPGPPPDPERWLPKRERSTYRPKRKDKRSQVRGSQGAVVREKHDGSVSNASNASSNGPNQKSSQGSSKGAASSEHPKSSSKSRKKNRS